MEKMGSEGSDRDRRSPDLPPPPPRYSMIRRPGSGTLGCPISLTTNHFKVSVGKPDSVFYQYTISFSQDDKPVDGKGIGRKILDKLYKTYSSDLAGKKFAYDGEKSLYTVGPLPQSKFLFTVVLEESFSKRERSPDGSPTTGKRSKRSFGSKTFEVIISYSAKIPLKSIPLALNGHEDKNTQDALRVLDIILRQQAANRECLLVRQSFFHDDSRNFIDVGGGVTGVRGFHSSFRTTKSGLSLNMDVSTTMIIKPGPVIDFLIANQNLRSPRDIDWRKAKRTLKNLRVMTKHTKREFKIIGLSEMTCNQQLFPIKARDRDGNIIEGQTVEITVYDYFTKQRRIDISFSQHMPCLDVGKPKRPNYLPMELCVLVSLQRYTKALSSMQRASLVEQSRQKPQEKMQTVKGAMGTYHFDNDPLLATCGISIDRQLTQVQGRVLETPKLKVGNSQDCIPNNGRWNFNNKKFFKPFHVENWVLVNFSARCDPSRISNDLINCGRNKGVVIDRPLALVEEDPSSRRYSPAVRVERMIAQMKAQLSACPLFVLCVLSERKTSEIYGPWKKKCLVDEGMVTQCIAPGKINDQFLTNLLLKINSKLGGINSLLAMEYSRCIPLITEIPTMILGMDVSHGAPGRSDVPSVAAVVSSLGWPMISRYRAAVRTQCSKLEMIDALYQPLEDGKDVGIMKELLDTFYNTSNGCKPKQIIVFRDGVSESQFNQVLNIELDQIVKTLQHLGEQELPKFTVIVAQKNHHTKLFQANSPQNVPPGTVVDTKIVHPRNYDFYMCAHAGMIGTSRPVHYHVLLDQIGFSPDALQNLIHSLSYTYQRSTTASSLVAPVCYAHLAAAQMSQFVRFDDLAETSSGHNSITSEGPIPVPQLPRLRNNVVNSMFFC